MLSSPVIGLKDVFGDTSNPRQFLEFQTHTRTLEFLSGPVEQTFNVRALVGEPGIGKTAVLLRLLQRMQSTAFTARLFWTQLRRSEFLHYFLHQLGVPRPATDIAEAQKQLTGVLEQNFSRGREVMIVIDEAHELKVSTLRGVAELLDCPLGRSKQLRVILAGLPLLKVRIASRPLADFSRRISGIASLAPLTVEESCSYITRKIELSEFRHDQHFTSDAIALIAKLTGTPREINNLCFEAAYRAEQRGYRRIDESLVLEVADEQGGTIVTRDGQEVSSTWGPLHRSNPHTAEFAPPGRGEEFEESGSRHGSQAVLQAAAVCRGSSDALSTCISNWFGDERLAWAGTTGELATSLEQPEAELMEILTSSSDGLRDRGIQLDLVESYGHSSAVRLRALESRKKREAETAAEAMIETREEELAGDGKSSAPLFESDVPELEGQQQPIDGISDRVATDDVPPSVFENTPEASLFGRSERILDHHTSRLRRAAMPVLLSIVALGLAILIVYVLLNRRGLSAHIPPTAAPSTVGEQDGAVAIDGADNGTPTTKPSPEPSSGLLQAARSGNANAQLELGTAYATGNGVPEDSVTAYTWLTLAFANGNNQAESLIRELTRRMDSAEIARIRWNLGQMYADGIGVPQDKVTAYMWHLLAELAGETRSRTAREQLAQTMTQAQKSEAQARASEWLKKHHQGSKTSSLPQR